MNHEQVREVAAKFSLPILQSGAFTPKINEAYNFTADLLREMIGFFMMGRTAMKLVGYKGCGKSTIVEQFHAAMGYALLTISCTPRTEAQDLIGRMLPTPNGLQYVYGPLVMAAKNGCSVMLDEYNVLDPGEATGLNQLLQGGSIYIPETGEVITPAPGFRVFATCNPADRSLGLLGRNEQDSANDDRFWVIWVDYIKAEDEIPLVEAVLAKSGVFKDDIPRVYAEKMVEVANKIRKNYMGESNDGSALEITISTRGMLAWAQGICVFKKAESPLQYSLDRAVLGSLPRSSSTRDAISQYLKDVFGTQV